MKIIIEGHKYLAASVKGILHGIDALENVEGYVILNYVGYFYNTQLHDCVFILPKVLLEDIDGKELVLGNMNLKTLSISIQAICLLKKKRISFMSSLYGFIVRLTCSEQTRITRQTLFFIKNCPDRERKPQINKHIPGHITFSYPIQ